MKIIFIALLAFISVFTWSPQPQLATPTGNVGDDYYDGLYFSGKGNTSYLALLDSAYMMMQPNAFMENLSMLYTPEWNGFIEGPTWHAWWVQNSFGPTYTMLPFMNKAYQTFIHNSQELWFHFMGDGIRKGSNGGYVAPVGSLCDCASPGSVNYRQGDFKVDKHDWGYGFTAAGLIMQSELLLISRNKADIEHYLPMLEKCAAFIDDRRNPSNNMFLAGPAADLLAPGYAGTGKLQPDGSYGKAYLAEISINYIAGLTRLIELEKMMGRKDKVRWYTNRIELIKAGLANFITPEGYFIRSVDPDGTKHGVYGAPVHGYFASSANCDAVTFRIADNKQAMKIYDMIQSIPELRPYQWIIPNYPSYDDMYQYNSLFEYGTWVNGGEWATLEARAQMSYYRAGAYQDAKASFKQMLQRSLSFRLDNPLAHFGAKTSQHQEPINCVYDCWGVPGGFLRGLFEYIYTADGLRLYPHIPSDITALEQKFPIYFGKKKIYISVKGSGGISAVKINGRAQKTSSGESIFLPLDATPGTLHVAILLGDSAVQSNEITESVKHKIKLVKVNADDNYWNIDGLRGAADTISKTTSPAVLNQIKKMPLFYNALLNNKRGDTYEAQHALLILNMVKAVNDRRQLKAQNKLQLLPERSQIAADNMFIGTIDKLTRGLILHLEKCKKSPDKEERRIYSLWIALQKS